MIGNHLTQTNNLVDQQSIKIKSDFSSDMKNRQFTSLLHDTKTTQYFKNYFPQHKDDFGVTYRNLMMDQNIKSKSLYGVQRMGFSNNSKRNGVWSNTLPTNDIVFKEIFETSEGSKERLKELINCVLKIDGLEVEDVETLTTNTTHVVKNEQSRFSKKTEASQVGYANKRYVDVRVKDKKTGKEYIVEVQIGFKDEDFKRFNEYAYKTFIETKKPVYLIAFCGSVNESESEKQYGTPVYTRKYEGMFLEHFQLSPVKVLKDCDVHGLKNGLDQSTLIKHSKQYAEQGVTKIFIDIDQYSKISENEELKDVAEFLKMGKVSSEKNHLKSDLEKKYKEIIGDPKILEKIKAFEELEERGIKALKDAKTEGRQEERKEAIFNMFDLEVNNGKIQKKYPDEDVDALYKEWSSK